MDNEIGMVFCSIIIMLECQCIGIFATKLPLFIFLLFEPLLQETVNLCIII